MSPGANQLSADLQPSVASQLLPNLVVGATPVHYWIICKNLMAEDLGKGKRKPKPKRDQDFIYEEDSIAPVPSEPLNVGSDLNQCESNSVELISENISVIDNFNSVWKSQSAPYFSLVQSLPFFNSALDLDNRSDSSSSAVPVVLDQSQSQIQNQNFQTTSRVQFSLNSVNKQSAVIRRRNSSTKETYLDLEGNFFSFGSSSCVTDMSESEGAYALPLLCSVCGKGERDNCRVCNPTLRVASNSDNQVMVTLSAVLDQMSVLSQEIHRLNDRISAVESKSDRESSSDQPRSSSKKKSCRKKKANRVDEERERQHVVIQEQLRSLKRSKEKVDQDEELAEQLLLGDLGRLMPKEKASQCSGRVASILRGVGASFPEDDSDGSSSSSSSGKESDATSRSKSRRKKVKSGAKIKKRPVIRTELWPHTIINEEDGGDVSSEDIILSKFLTGFTLIMASCGKVELLGRTALLRAVGMVLEVLPWTEARTFHNLVMIKIEQGKINWNHKFSLLANEFVDKKVRQNLRVRSSYSGGNSSSSSSRGSFAPRGRGRGSGASYGGRYQGGPNRPLNLICWQWNNGNCTFGEGCRKWHCCRACAENGKWGESHQASTHQGAVPRNQSNQRV